MEIRKERVSIETVGQVTYTLTYSDITGEYGMSAELNETGERSAYSDISPNENTVTAIFEAAVRGTVTPATLGDIIYDMLCN